MNREECLKIVATAREKGDCANLTDANLSDADLSRANLSGANLSDANLNCANLSGANLSRANLNCANLSDADLTDANLSGANLSGANLDFASWPLWCGGTQVKLDRHLSLQLIYHAFNQQHDDPEIIAALEAIRPLAQEFIDKFRYDAPSLREKV
jgi:hypothetical protein